MFVTGTAKLINETLLLYEVKSSYYCFCLYALKHPQTLFASKFKFSLDAAFISTYFNNKQIKFILPNTFVLFVHLSQPNIKIKNDFLYIIKSKNKYLIQNLVLQLFCSESKIGFFKNIDWIPDFMKTICDKNGALEIPHLVNYDELMFNPQIMHFYSNEDFKYSIHKTKFSTVGILYYGEKGQMRIRLDSGDIDIIICNNYNVSSLINTFVMVTNVTVIFEYLRNCCYRYLVVDDVIKLPFKYKLCNYDNSNVMDIKEYQFEWLIIVMGVSTLTTKNLLYILVQKLDEITNTWSVNVIVIKAKNPTELILLLKPNQYFKLLHNKSTIYNARNLLMVSGLKHFIEDYHFVPHSNYDKNKMVEFSSVHRRLEQGFTSNIEAIITRRNQLAVFELDGKRLFYYNIDELDAVHQIGLVPGMKIRIHNAVCFKNIRASALTSFEILGYVGELCCANQNVFNPCVLYGGLGLFGTPERVQIRSKVVLIEISKLVYNNENEDYYVSANVEDYTGTCHIFVKGKTLFENLFFNFFDKTYRKRKTIMEALESLGTFTTDIQEEDVYIFQLKNKGDNFQKVHSFFHGFCKRVLEIDLLAECVSSDTRRLLKKDPFPALYKVRKIYDVREI